MKSPVDQKRWSKLTTEAPLIAFFAAGVVSALATGFTGMNENAAIALSMGAGLVVALAFRWYGTSQFYLIKSDDEPDIGKQHRDVMRAFVQRRDE